MNNLSGIDIAIAAARAMDDKKADDVQILRMSRMMVETDYFVICSCMSFPQMQSITQAVREAMEQLNVKLRRQEGRSNNQWILLDYGEVVAHIFLASERQYYNLEKLWADAERIPFKK
ncbi:MAG TPA: ribosome silencing factor [Limnochordia bacterium]|nr:ribosome silencing factor [Bacillota bacterium]HKM17744.1 ribosome silencing factor [Limnochordia bacterium]